MTADVSVVLIDDHLMVRKGIELLLRSHGIAVIGVAEQPAHGVELIRRRRPDVALVDIALDGADGTDVSRELGPEPGGPAILLYTGSTDPVVLDRALAAAVEGVALKGSPPAELVEAIRVLADGGTYFDQRLQLLLNREPRAAERVLTGREREILSLLAEGLTGEQIAEALVLSPQTVRTHIRNAMTRLGAKTRVHALALALQSGELSPRQP
jgi:DNA-binding NarL/FixJ family response regulator